MPYTLNCPGATDDFALPCRQNSPARATHDDGGEVEVKSFGMFQAPVVARERTPLATFDWLVDQASVADRAGFTEFWCGEHCTPAWETVPSPELVLAAAIRETDNIILAPGAHLLPYHHPATLAMQVAWM